MTSRWLRILRVTSLVLLSGVALAAVLLFITLRDLPQLEGMRDYRPPVVTRILDRNGELIARVYKDERRTVVSREEMPDRLIKAFLAAEDADFYEHGGVDLAGVVAALLQELRHQVLGGPRRGGSTITQQTAKTFLLSNERTYTRKLREMVLAHRIEQAFTKDEILFLYLNQIYFGNGAYGVEEAAQTYFGKHVRDLTLSECATLASVPKHPNVINPIFNPNRTRERRAYVLGQMEKRGFASREEVAKALKEPLGKSRSPAEFLNRTPWIAESVRQYLLKRYGEDKVYREGLVAYAATDARMDVAAQRALRAGLDAADKRMGWRGPLVRLDAQQWPGLLEAARKELEERLPPDPAERAGFVWDFSELEEGLVQRSVEEAAKQWRLAHRDPGVVVGGIVTKVDNARKEVVVDLGTVQGTLALGEMKWARPHHPHPGGPGPAPKEPSDVVRAGDVILVRLLADGSGGGKNVLTLGLEQVPKVQGAVVAVEAETRRVRAMAGGWSFAHSSFNRASQAQRQPGSSFKPFIYALAIQSRRYTPATMVVDAPKVFADVGAGRDWKPMNSDGKFRGDIRLRQCLTHSVNTCSVSLVEALTPEKVVELAQQVGLGANWPISLTLALGTGEVTPLAMANAYATFADEGRFAEPVLVERVKTADGRVLEEATVEKHPVLDASAAYVMLSMMRSVVESGTAWRIRELGRPVSGKTGTTNEARDAWFVGCIPGMCTAVYVGMDDHSPMGREEAGGRAAAPIWLDFHKTVLEGTPVRDFTQPEGVEVVPIDPQSGLRAAPDQADALPEVFITGTAPTELARPGQGGRPAEWMEDAP